MIGPRKYTTIVFPGETQVRSRPLIIWLLEFWFLWVHEFWSHNKFFRIKLPTGNKEWWGDDGFEAAYHVWYTWTLNFDERVESSTPTRR